ncbi:MAG TPA: UDP-2,3-diacylglucosamine diphosphatase [Methanotrichaceae archaeon]|nr:UDP-2,3-diacylglucosamine diphosphatase [Methanotrichaceae archaeon]
MIVVVSDVHLAEKQNDAKVEKDDREFLEFLNHIKDDQLSDGGDLVILGDMVDFWRRDFAKALMDVEDAISVLASFKDDVKVHYVVGNHDYYMLKLKETLSDGFPFENVAEYVRLQEGGEKFFFTHGYQLEVLANPYYKSLTSYKCFAENLCLVGDDTGNAASKLWDTIQASKSILENLRRVPSDLSGTLKSMMEGPDERLCGRHEAALTIENLAKSRSRTIYLGMGIDEFLVYGHTHMPFHDEEYRVANVGSWNKSPCSMYNYMVIENGVVEPKVWV